MRSGLVTNLSSTTRARLVLLVATVLMPLALFTVVMFLKFTSAERARYRASAEATAQQISATIDRNLIVIVATLQAIATSPLLGPDGNLPAFKKQALDLLRTTGTELYLRDREGHDLTAPDRIGTPADPAAAAADQAVFRTGNPDISGLQSTRPGAPPSVLVAVPVRRDGETVYSLGVVLDRNVLDPTLIGVAQPGWIFSLIDRDDRVIATSRSDPSYVGRFASPDLRREATGNSGSWTGETLDHLPVLAAYARSPLTGWRVAVGISLAKLEVPLQQLTVAVAGSGLLIVILAILLALQVARAISRPIAQLTVAADRLGRGESVPHLHTGLAEVDDVGAALVTAEEIVGIREHALQASQERFRAAISAVQGTIWTNDRNGRMVGDQPGWAALTGQSYEEYQGYGWAKAIHPDDVAPTLAAWQAAVRDRRPFIFEHRVRGPDGAYRRFSVRAIPAGGLTGDIAEWVGVHTDVTEEFEAKTALAAREADLRELNATLEHRVQETSAQRDRIWRISTELMLLAQFDGTIVAINPAWASTLGWTEEELRGTSLLALIHPDDLLEAEATPNQSAPFSAPRFEQRYRHRDGHYRWLSWTAVTEAGLIHSIARDVTAEKEAASALRRAEEQLRQSQKMEVVGQLTGGIAHDFNNLLTVVTGNLEMAQRRTGEDARLRRNLAAAFEGAQRAAVLTHRLLAFSRQTPLRSEIVDLNAVLGEMLELIQRTLGETVLISTSFAPGLWPIEADRNQVENAILNLCVNARDAMPKGGVLTIETANRSLDRLHDQGGRGELPPGDYAEISVRDEGTGIDPAIQDRVFEPFFTTKPVGKGTGLGLSQVFGFMRQSHGSAVLDSVPGRGTTVRLLFPRLHRLPEPDAAAPAAVPASQRVEPDGVGETCLVIEDEIMVREFSVAALEEAGFRVVSAADGPSGLSLLDAHPEATVLFTDLVLTGPLDGRAVADEAHRRRPDLKLLFTTGYTSDAVLIEGRLEAGIELITKPFTATDLVLKVRALLAAGTGTAR